jgi:hypothetical protein
MKPLLASRYISWMAIRPLRFGERDFAPGEKVPQKYLEPMRDPEVLIRTNRLAAVTKDMNKIPRMLRKLVTEEEEMRAKILAPRGGVGQVVPTHLLASTPEPEPVTLPTFTDEDVEPTEFEKAHSASAGPDTAPLGPADISDSTPAPAPKESGQADTPVPSETPEPEVTPVPVEEPQAPVQPQADATSEATPEEASGE